MLIESVKPDIAGRARLAEGLARKVGRAARSFREGEALLGVENKGLQDFVTIADRDAEAAIRAGIAAEFPDDAFIGEESGGLSGDACTWVVDPIDGTTNYIRGFRHWGVSIACIAGGVVEAGVIYDAAHDQVYAATKGGGAFRDGKEIRASKVTEPERALAMLGHSRATSFSEFLSVAQDLYNQGIDFRRMGAAAIGLVRVADGTADLYYERQLNAWDMLAGTLIAHEAGAVVMTADLGTLLASGGPVIAAAQGLLPVLSSILAQAGPSCRPL